MRKSLIIGLFLMTAVCADAQAIFAQDVYERRANTETTRYQASVYVPLDSWIYPVFDRLIAMGYVQTASMMNRPWSRLECARLLAEGHVNAAMRSDDTSAEMLAALDREFSQETAVVDGEKNIAAGVESAYSRATLISGTPLRDGYNFGETLANDFGRPYGQGGNQVSGLALRASTGPFAFYLRGEYQYAGPTAGYSVFAQQTISGFNSLGIQGTLPYDWNLRLGTTSRPRTIEAYVSANVANWQISFGQQSLWWGPDRSTSLMLSNNAEAMPMLRFNRVKPGQLPWILHALGPIHFDAFLARQGGVHYVAPTTSYTVNGDNEFVTFGLYGNASQALNPSPYLWGLHLTIQPTPNFEFGFEHTVIFAGYGRPLTVGTFLHTFSIYGNEQVDDPGKRVTSFDFAYHLPKLRDKVLLYTEAMSWDDPIQGKFVARYAFDPGIYLPHLPHLSKIDLRAEGAYTDLPKLDDTAYFYSNLHYIQGYTNYGQILGSWIGREGRGGQVSTSYWFTPRNTFTLSYRKMTVGKELFQGGNMDELSGTLKWFVRPALEVVAGGQYEHWKFPLLNQNATSDFTTTLGIQFHPKLELHSR